MADIKTLLKEARKHIDDKNFTEAQECCKNILRKDKQNYLALVLLGKSLQDSDQAPLAYQKAIASKPDHPLAWQGLASYYERKDDNASKMKLLSVYPEILKLQIEEEKAVEIITKLGQLGTTLKIPETLPILADYIQSNGDTKSTTFAEKQFLDILKSDVLCKSEAVVQILEILNKILLRDPTDALELVCGKVILQKNCFASAVEEVIGLKFFKSNAALREWVCKYLCRMYVQNNSFLSLDIEKHINVICDGIENSKYPELLKAIISYDKSLYLEAYKQCIPLINYQQAEVTEATFVLQCTIKLKKWSLVQKLATNFLNKTKDEIFAIKLKKILFLSLAKQSKWKQAIAIANTISDGVMDHTELSILAECCIEISEPVQHILEKLKTTKYYTQLQALLLLKEQKYGDVITILQNCTDSALCSFYLGKAYWALQQYDQSLIYFLNAAKLDSNHADTFLYLGHFYRYKKDLQKAKKCYEKANCLNSADSEIARNLSEIYLNLGLKDNNLELLSNADKNVQFNKSWIYFRLGLHYLEIREWENSITQFRAVIKTDQNNIKAFECLADAYYSRGSFTSALRAYNKVILFNQDKNVHCLTRIGLINSLVTKYDEAIQTFEQVLALEPQSLLALKGIAETWMRVAKKKMSAKLYGSARECAQNAIDILIKAIFIKEFSCFWKLLGDTMMFITRLPTKYAYINMRNSIKDNSGDISKKEKLEIFPQAIACYTQVAKLKHQLSSYELSSAYLSYYCESKNEINSHISYNLAITCIKDKPVLWQNWNLLGKICFVIKKYTLTQHCFIKALLVTRKWSIARVWCNLGTLYLKLKLHKLANYCFWRGQSTLPSHPHSWIGQGLIAEAIREEEAMDLFRHASCLGYHPESVLAYGDWVCRTLEKNYQKEGSEYKYVIESLYAIPYAIDLMEWFYTFHPTNACALTILGILQERCGMLRAAFSSFSRALQLADKDRKNIALLNLGRLLTRMEKYEEAITAYKAISEASLNGTCGLALALYKVGQYEEAYSAYDTALHWLTSTENEKSDILVAMSGILYKFKGGDDAKTLLFQSIQVSQTNPTANSLFAICSLGLMHRDQSLSKLALTELQKYERGDSAHGFDIGFLKSFMSVSENDIENAIKIMSDSLHDHPNETRLWFYMAQLCLRASEKRAQAGSCCAQRAICLAQNKKGLYSPAKMISTASVAEHIAGNKHRAFRLAKQGLHLYPSQAEIWSTLLLKS